MLASDDFLQQVRRSATDFTRQRALPLKMLIPLLLNFRKGTNRDELDQFFETPIQRYRRTLSLKQPFVALAKSSSLKPSCC